MTTETLTGRSTPCGSMMRSTTGCHNPAARNQPVIPSLSRDLVASRLLDSERRSLDKLGMTGSGSTAPGDDGITGHGSKHDDSTFEVSSGNVFADVGLPDADAALAKADVALRIAGLIEERGWTTAEASKVLGMDEAAILRIVRGNLIDVPLERLLAGLTLLGHDVGMTIGPATEAHGSVAVRGAAG